MNDGLTGIALILLMASSRVPSALGLAGLSKPTWLSLICRNVRPAGSAACAEPTSPSERGTPPEMVQSTPVPAQVIHSRTRRRLTPGLLWLWSWSNSLIAFVSLDTRDWVPWTGSGGAAVYSRIFPSEGGPER